MLAKNRVPINRIKLSRDARSRHSTITIDTYGDENYINGKFELYYVINETVLNEKEKEYLENVIRPFKDRVVSIEKVDTEIGEEFIYIDLENDKSMFLPKFAKRDMYKGMIAGKSYTLEELGL